MGALRAGEACRRHLGAIARAAQETTDVSHELERQVDHIKIRELCASVGTRALCR